MQVRRLFTIWFLLQAPQSKQVNDKDNNNSDGDSNVEQTDNMMYANLERNNEREHGNSTT